MSNDKRAAFEYADNLKEPWRSDPVVRGFFPNGDPWPAWAWEDYRSYGSVFFDEKNQRIDPLTVKLP